MKILKTSALLEGLSLISLLFIAMPCKYLLNMPILVRIIGPLHGVLFIAFIAVLLLYFLKQKITVIQLLIGIVASFIPFGTFIFTEKVLPSTDSE